MDNNEIREQSEKDTVNINGHQLMGGKCIVCDTDLGKADNVKCTENEKDWIDVKED